VTNQNEENQLYLLKYGDGMLTDTLIKLYRHCDSEIPLYPVTNLADKVSAGAVIREVLLATLKVLINLTHDFNNECKYKVFILMNVVKIYVMIEKSCCRYNY
jgi:hypothetical protein